MSKNSDGLERTNDKLERDNASLCKEAVLLEARARSAKVVGNINSLTLVPYNTAKSGLEGITLTLHTYIYIPSH
jgi:hypothetical protein